jgi:phosphoglycerate kinase
VFVRADLNVPVKNGVVTDLTRIERTARTIAELLDGGAAVVVPPTSGGPRDAIRRCP